MKLKYAIENVDRTDRSHSPDPEVLGQPLGIDNGWDVNYSLFEEQFKSYWLMQWMCTDTPVGMQVVCLYDEAVAVIIQTSRKGDKSVDFISKEAAEKVKQAMLALMPEREDQVPLVDLDEEIDDTYTVGYSSMLMVKKGIFEGQEVVVRKTFGPYNASSSSVWSKVDVVLPNAEVKRIDVQDLQIPLHLKSAG